MGEVVVADNTVTDEGVVLAQRLEQLAEPGGVCIQGDARETVPRRLPFDFENLGAWKLCQRGGWHYNHTSAADMVEAHALYAHRKRCRSR